MNTIVRVPAIRGRMGGRTYFTVSMKLKTVPRFFEFQNYNALVPEERAQRVLNKQRIPAIRDYLIEKLARAAVAEDRGVPHPAKR